jgi:hypothetical protein
MYNFLFSELHDKALQFYQRKAYIVSLEYLNEAISLDLTISSIRLSKTFELRGLVRIQLKQYLIARKLSILLNCIKKIREYTVKLM